ncbi:MAG: HIT domain-containing protein [Acidobacteriia bacterium]|nr:HIT domain-containing protein [Terriglobia bacterium]
MDYLWTPWRYQYVVKSEEKSAECVFCAAVADTEHDRERLVVYRATYNVVMLNRYPYTSGHLMLVPHQHVASLRDVTDETLVELIRLARVAEIHLRAIYRPGGLNIGFNIGRSAGAGIADHLHLHALPRWTGDTNFMTVIGETRVLPEDLEVTWERVREAFARG